MSLLRSRPPDVVFLSDAPTDSIGTAPSVIHSLLASLAALQVWCSYPSPCPPPVRALDQILPSHAIAIINKLSTASARRLRGCLARPPSSSPQSQYILPSLLICSPPSCLTLPFCPPPCPSVLQTPPRTLLLLPCTLPLAHPSTPFWTSAICR